jgi:superoxide dismutase, Fe-Mn family
MLARTTRTIIASAPATKAGTRAMSSLKLPDLSWDYGELEPVISSEIMTLHYTKHHQAYVTNGNIALEKLEEAKNKNDNAAILALQPALKFNVGGHINHSIFWKNLASPTKGGGELGDGELRKKIESQWGNVDALQTQLSAATVGVQGSGWGWLGYDKATDRLVVTTTPNQDPLQPSTGLIPLLGIDVWEHAYYLQYKNVRPDYVKEIWKVINWADVENNLKNAK